jgi:hypothetical protein
MTRDSLATIAILGAMLPALGACAAPATSAATLPTRPADGATPLTAVLAAGVCPELAGRLFSLASGDDGVVDTTILVKQCAAKVEHDDLSIVADAYAWVAVDRDFGVIGVHEFVHATVHGEVRVHASARYTGGRIEVTLNPFPPTKIAVEPVGALDLAPLNWASLLAIELAPAAGASPEALAKTRLREEVERTLASALASPLVVSYDARRGSASLGGVTAQGGSQRIRIAPHGTALVGPFPPSSAGHAHMHVAPGHHVAMKAVCCTHAERIVDADRRGDAVWTDDWTLVQGAAEPALKAMPCRWALALRVTSEPTVVDLELLEPEAAPLTAQAPERWVSIDEVTNEDAPPDADLTIIAANDIWRATVVPQLSGVLPAVLVLSPDEHVSLRAQRREGSQLMTVAEARVPLDTPGNTTAPIVLTTSDGHRLASLRVRARVRRAEPEP